MKTDKEQLFYVFGATESLFTMLAENLPHRTPEELLNAVEGYCMRVRQQLAEDDEGEEIDGIPWDYPIDYVH